jgi:hypothetical protein
MIINPLRARVRVLSCVACTLAWLGPAYTRGGALGQIVGRAIDQRGKPVTGLTVNVNAMDDRPRAMPAQIGRKNHGQRIS